MTKVTLFARDNDKPGNREVVAFIRQHLPEFVRAGLRFTFTVADPIEKQLVARGIDKLPAITISDVNYLTPVEIKSALLKYIAGKPGSRFSGRGPKKPEDEMQAYYASEMNMEKWEREQDEDEDNPNKKDIMTRVQAEMERRQGENDRRGPSKPQGRRTEKKRDVPEESVAEPAPRTKAPRSKTPQERLRDAGGDPGNKDDQLILSMMECSDD